MYFSPFFYVGLLVCYTVTVFTRFIYLVACLSLCHLVTKYGRNLGDFLCDMPMKAKEAEVAYLDKGKMFAWMTV
jgi:hypothetical protein